MNNWQNDKKIVYRMIYDASHAFYLWKSLRLSGEQYKEIFDRNTVFWGTIKFCSEISTFLLAAMLFEKGYSDDKTITIPFLLKYVPAGSDKHNIEEEIKKLEPTRKILWDWRRKLFAHKDAVAIRNIKDFIEEPPEEDRLNDEKMEIFINSAKSIFEKIDFACSKQLTSWDNEIEEKVKKSVEHIVKELGYSI